jgi:hypothetical protein
MSATSRLKSACSRHPVSVFGQPGIQLLAKRKDKTSIFPYKLLSYTISFSVCPRETVGTAALPSARSWVISEVFYGNRHVLIHRLSNCATAATHRGTKAPCQGYLKPSHFSPFSVKTLFCGCSFYFESTQNKRLCMTDIKAIIVHLKNIKTLRLSILLFLYGILTFV